MHFGATVREILTASCGRDLRDASPSTPLPALDSAVTLRTLAANVELAFGIEMQPDDLPRLRTVRDVLRCIRLRRWEQRVTETGQIASEDAPRQPPARPVFVAPTRDPRERLIRYTPRPLPSPPTFTADRTAKRL
jgi:acyl carrier protein